MHRATVGICEDDADLRAALVRALEAEDMAPRATATGHEAVTVFSAQPTDALIIDIMLPDADGRDVCQSLRAQGVGSPVLFLTARDALVDRLSGFHAGGDDYLTKPFALAELLVRIGALLRRAPDNGATELGAGLRLDPAGHALHHGDRSEPLTPTEFRLLAALAARQGDVVRRRDLVAAAWPDGAIVHDNTLDSYVARLRRKLRTLGADGTIATARGVGYRLP
jgi:two-component system, OmpR family, response regulator